MDSKKKQSTQKQLKNLVIGPAKTVDSKTFHKLSLIAFFAWIGLGADGLSSSSYGPEEAFRVLQAHPYLGVFVALASTLTIFVIGGAYSRIIELFPSTTGSGGYIVASTFLSPKVGMISGSALLVDYILTITVSIAASADAIFSFLPAIWLPFKLEFAILMLVVLTLLNMRGVKESVVLLAPIFVIFVITHVFLIVYAVYTNWINPSTFVSLVSNDVHSASLELGFFGMILLVLRAYSMGAGTYTGIEAVSNGIPILREPKIKTAKKTMDYMMISLAFTAGGLVIAYILFHVGPVVGKTFNAVLLESVTASWGGSGHYFLLVTLISEAALLFVAAQTGFIGGPMILANMALDGWTPKRFALLSDRFVNQNGILIMGGGALAMMVLAAGSVQFLVVLYSINVFLTFTLSILGSLLYFWRMRNAKIRNWLRKFLSCLLGLAMASFILVSVVVLKFEEGGWLTLIITGILVYIALIIKRHYEHINTLLQKLDTSIIVADSGLSQPPGEVIRHLETSRSMDANAKTAVIFVKGFNGVGLHMVAHILRMFPDFRNFVFVQIGRMDSGNFKGMVEIDRLKADTKLEVEKYVGLMRHQGYYAESRCELGIDVAEVVEDKIAPDVMQKFPNAVFFGGQIILPEYSFLSRFLDNYTLFVLQRRLNSQNIPFVILPIKV